ncbi:MAG: histidine phosphatase family protein [Phycisphaerales bacterium]|nr:histidine phosphatase family protein [Phycisphaerales bacterium]
MASRRRGRALWLLRAGETPWGAEGRVQGSADLPLAPGVREMLALEFAHLPPTAVAVVHHPADEAATDTAKLAARSFRGKPAAVDDLGEPHLGLLEGLTLGTFAERYPTRHRQWQDDPLALVAPEGEPLVDARARILHTIVRLIRRSRGAEVAVVLHPLALGLVRCVLCEAPSTEMRHMVSRRGQVERYILPVDAADRLQAAAEGA